MEILKELLPLAQTGSAGVAIILAVAILKMYLKNIETMENVTKRYDTSLRENTDSNIKLAIAITGQTAAIGSLEKTIDRRI